MRNLPCFYCLLFLTLIFSGTRLTAQELKPGTINRKALVQRHNLKLTDSKLRGPSQVGNGEFAYGFDITGMQTFNDQFTTLSQWGWHSTPPPKGQTAADFKKSIMMTNGRPVLYDMPDTAHKELTDWLVANTHKFNLARIGLWLKKADGSDAKLTDLQNPEQTLDLWTAKAESNFTLEGQPVKVTTVADPKRDIVGFKIESPLISSGRLGVFIEFPYANLNNFSNASDYKKPDLHQTTLIQKGLNKVVFDRKLDSTTYQVAAQWTGNGRVEVEKAHRYKFSPIGGNSVEYVFYLSPKKITGLTPSVAQVTTNSNLYWPSFWKSGGAIDLSESKDPRWKELERRIVLSEYNMKINASGKYPPQETGLVNNSWHGRFHYEMMWWHLAQYALWDRWDLLNPPLKVYQDNLESAKGRAKLEGYLGARFPKCTGPDGREAPGRHHSTLVWQQPHSIFFANLDYRAHPTPATLKKWAAVIDNSADFLASYAYFDPSRKQYILGSPLTFAPENNNWEKDINPAFELGYWRYGLKTAQQLRKKMGLPEKPLWNKVHDNLTPIPQRNGLYDQWENAQDMWTKYNYEHPTFMALYGMLPADGIDIPTMDNTFKKVVSVWQWERGWGWDFPMMAMTAARLGHPDEAVNMLLHPAKKNGFDEHGMVGGGNPYPYFPTNGGLLYAVAMMAAGWDGDKGLKQPGFPHDKTWVVKWEGLKKAP